MKKTLSSFDESPLEILRGNFFDLFLLSVKSTSSTNLATTFNSMIGCLKPGE